HGGGALPMLAGRIVGLAGNRKDLADRVPGGVRNELSRLYLDVVGVHSRACFDAVRDLVGPSRVLFGTDIPFWAAEAAVSGLANLKLDPKELAAVESGNAAGLFPRMRA